MKKTRARTPGDVRQTGAQRDAHISVYFAFTCIFFSLSFTRVAQLERVTSGKETQLNISGEKNTFEFRQVLFVAVQRRIEARHLFGIVGIEAQFAFVVRLSRHVFLISIWFFEIKKLRRTGGG